MNQLLDVARIDAGRLVLARADVDLGALARDVCDRFDEQATAAGCALSLHVDGDVVAHVDADAVEQVLTNLVANALSHGRGAPIAVDVLGDAAPGVDVVHLSVRDGGPGIAPADQARIFERFERAQDRGAVRGLGLGLWIVRRLVEAHGGTVSVESTPGAGATFVVALPRAR